MQFCRENLNIPFTINVLEPGVSEKIAQITRSDMPTVVMDITGNQKAINSAFQYMAHGARMILTGLQKGAISFSHPEFHKREATLMSSRNATRHDFEYVVSTLKKGLVNPASYITHLFLFNQVKVAFESWLNSANGMVKVMVEVE